MAQKHLFRQVTLLLAFTLLSSRTALTQSLALEPIGTFAEVYLNTPKVSGNLLVGLRWNAGPGAFDPDGVRLQTPLKQGTTQVCVDVASKDGRYAAENLYKVPEQTTGLANFVSRTNYRPKLRDYETNDIAVIIHAAPSCDAANVRTVIPATIGIRDADTSGSERHLVAYINADSDRITMSLIGKNDMVIAAGTCAPAGGGVQIAFSARCMIKVPDGVAAVTPRLRLAVKERFKTVLTDYTLLLP